jgi:uroporphyrinogen III methyltransferase / synthase
VSLEGRVVLVTRPAEQAEPLVRRLVDLGAEVLVAPTVTIEFPTSGGPLDRAIEEAAGGAFQWIAFTSASGVRAWMDRAGALGVQAPRARVAAVGDATAAALREAGLVPDLVPEAFTTAALGAAFPQGTGRVLLPRADIAIEDLEDALRSRGWDPVRVEAYRIRPADRLPTEAKAALRDGRVDAVTFTSPSTVHGFVRLAGVSNDAAVVCIGPVTADAAEAARFVVDEVAEPHTTDGLVDAVCRALL